MAATVLLCGPRPPLKRMPFVRDAEWFVCGAGRRCWQLTVELAEVYKRTEDDVPFLLSSDPWEAWPTYL